MDTDAAPGTGSPSQAHGFPSPAQDYFHGGLDLNRLLVADRTSTFILRVSGNAMAADGMADGDEVIVDRSLTPKDSSVVVAEIDGELTLRRLHLRAAGALLRTDDGVHETRVPHGEPLMVWGVVTRSLHRV